MKTFLVLFVLLFAGLKSYASQLVIGLFSKNLVVWNIWEYKDGALKQHLLLFNQGEKEINIAIKEKRFTDNGITFGKVRSDTTYHRLDLGAGKLVKLAYPQTIGRLVFMEFLENQKSIGILEINLSRPPAAFVEKKYGYYSNEAINSGRLSYWVKLTSIYDLKASISFGSDLEATRNGQSQLVKRLPPGERTTINNSDLVALKPTDNTIIEISPGREEATFSLNEQQSNSPFIPISLLSNHLENGRLLMSSSDEIGLFQPK